MAAKAVLKRRRRRKRYRSKYSLEEAIKRAKKLLPIMVPHLDLELNYYVDAVEPQAFEVLSSLGVSGEAREHLLGYIKKAISIGLRLGGETFLNELEALKDEYILRGFDREVLDRLDEVIFEKVEVRKSVYIEVVRGVYEGMKYILVSTIKSVKLALKYVTKVSLPIVETIAQLRATASAILKIFSMYVRPHLPVVLGFSLTSRPPKPLITLISSSLALSIGRSVMDVKKPLVSSRLVVRPSRPSPSITTVVSTTVGVSKSP